MDTGIMYSGERKTGLQQLQLELSDYAFWLTLRNTARFQPASPKQQF